MKGEDAKAKSACVATDWKNVMSKYKMNMSQEGLMGAGTSSICRKGKVDGTGEEVGIKVYKTSKGGKSEEENRLVKFKRQVEVLKQLQDPFVKPSNPRLWCPQMDNAKPERLFMRLIDSSVDGKGEPGPDAADNILYVITELAQYSLKDYLADRKSENAPLSKDTVRDMTKAVVMVMAGLHAKGFVHLDLKPENMMVFDGCLKLIDVDGCVQMGEMIAITNPSISFSPCYCAPEWANFLLAENEAKIEAKDGLDVWSAGCTICEFVALDAILKPMYANFLRHSHSHREAGFLFMDWLSSIKKPPAPKTIAAFDSELADLVTNWLLVCNKDGRKTCAECLSSPYLEKSKLHRSSTNPLSKSGDGDLSEKSMPFAGSHTYKHKLEQDHSSKAIHKGMLWKLNSGADAKDVSQWLERDFWLANNGSLCYYSQKDNKRLVLLDSHKLHQAEVSPASSMAKEHTFQIKCNCIETNCAEDESQVFTFAGNTADEAKEWMKYLTSAAGLDVMPTMWLGKEMVEDLQFFKLSVKNRRMKVENDYEHQFEPVFKGKLWKVKAAGDALKEEDWFSRDSWLSRNGSFVYWSVREGRELVYYTSADVHRATIEMIPAAKSRKPFSFQVNLPPNDGMEFPPGEFAAESAEMLESWIKEFGRFKE